MPSFSNFDELQGYLNWKISLAIDAATDRLLDELQTIIQARYYDLYPNPKVYQRTYAFLGSASKKMFGQLTGMVFMDEDCMNYGEFWSAEQQLEYASEGYHGRKDIKTEGKFWEEFIDFCKTNCFKILKEEMIKQGIPLK